ncbi:MAG: site-2 protease family protein [Archangium sp.]
MKREADQLESSGDVIGALEKLRAMEPLLPSQSTQAIAIRKHIATLEPKAGEKPKTQQPRGLFAGIGAVLLAIVTKGKFLLLGLMKLPTVLSFFVSAALWRDGSSGIGLGLVVLGSIYVHEMGHTFAFRRYGIEVTPPMFVPGFGAFVRGSRYPHSLAAIGDVALSGPLWGGASGIVVLIIGLVLKQTWLIGAALLIAEVNLFNLIPVWQLDGARATATLSKSQVTTVGLVALLAGAVAASPMALIAGAGLVIRRWVKPPTGDDKRTFYSFLGLVIGLLVLRFAANWLVADSHSQESALQF